MRRQWTAMAVAAIVLARLSAGHPAATREVDDDRDHDGLDDRLEATLATTHFPTLHEFASADVQEECAFPSPRPVLFRARPRVDRGHVMPDDVAVTYVLLYAEDCGGLGHLGDDEAFTIFLHHDPRQDRWVTVSAVSVAHRSTIAQTISTGPGRDMWVSRNKHATYATFAACGEGQVIVDQCAENGPSPAAYALLNVGEPWAKLSDDVGDVMLAAGADPARARRRAPWASGRRMPGVETRLVQALASGHLDADAEVDDAYLLFRGYRIWNHEPFLGSGDITSELFLDLTTRQPGWDMEGASAPGSHPH